MRMTYKRYASALSFAVLAASSFWALTQYYGDGSDFWSASNTGFALVFLNGIFGVWRYGRPEKGTRLLKLFETTFFLANIYSIALIAVDIYLYYAFSFELAYMHVVYPFVAVLPYMTQKKKNREIIDIVTFLSDLSVSIICTVNQNYYGLASAVTHAFCHFIITTRGKTFGMPSMDFFNYGIAIFVFFSLQALIDAEIYWINNGKQQPEHVKWLRHI